MTLPETYSKQHMAMALIAGYALGVALVYWATRPQPASITDRPTPGELEIVRARVAAMRPKPCTCTDKSEVVHLDH